jgi:hypothetical protein
MEHMTDPAEERDAGVRRGEAAWKAHKAVIADRNEKARKAGKERRLAHERRIDAQRRAAGR